MAKVVDIPWQLATLEDFRYPDVTGHKPAGTTFLHWYIGRVHEVASHNKHVAQYFYRVVHLLNPPPLLFHPAVMFRLFGARPV